MRGTRRFGRPLLAALLALALLAVLLYALDRLVEAHG